MSNSGFEIGDIVECIRPTKDSLSLKTHYEVLQCRPSMTPFDPFLVVLDNRGAKTGWYSSRFKLVAKSSEKPDKPLAKELAKEFRSLMKQAETVKRQLSNLGFKHSYSAFGGVHSFVRTTTTHETV